MIQVDASRNVERKLSGGPWLQKVNALYENLGFVLFLAWLRARQTAAADSPEARQYIVLDGDPIPPQAQPVHTRPKQASVQVLAVHPQSRAVGRVTAGNEARNHHTHSQAGL